MKEIRTIGWYTNDQGKARSLAAVLSRKYSADVCFKQDPQISDQYRLFAYCSRQLCQRMQDFLAGVQASSQL